MSLPLPTYQAQDRLAFELAVSAVREFSTDFRGSSQNTFVILKEVPLETAKARGVNSLFGLLAPDFDKAFCPGQQAYLQEANVAHNWS